MSLKKDKEEAIKKRHSKISISDTKNVSFNLEILHFQDILTEPTSMMSFISWKNDAIPILLNDKIKTCDLNNIKTDKIKVKDNPFLKCAFRKKAN